MELVLFLRFCEVCHQVLARGVASWQFKQKNLTRLHSWINLKCKMIDCHECFLALARMQNRIKGWILDCCADNWLDKRDLCLEDCDSPQGLCNYKRFEVLKFLFIDIIKNLIGNVIYGITNVLRATCNLYIL